MLPKATRIPNINGMNSSFGVISLSKSDETYYCSGVSADGMILSATASKTTEFPTRDDCQDGTSRESILDKKPRPTD